MFLVSGALHPAPVALFQLREHWIETAFERNASRELEAREADANSLMLTPLLLEIIAERV
jgi:hypothetical protein